MSVEGRAWALCQPLANLPQNRARQGQDGESMYAVCYFTALRQTTNSA